MPESLSIEKQPLSERAQYASHDVAGEFTATPTQNVASQLGVPFSYSNMVTTNYDAMFGAALAPNTAVGIQNFRLSDAVYGYGSATEATHQPTFQGRVTGPVSNLLAIFDRWQLTDKDAMLLLGTDAVSYINDLRVGTVGLATRDMQDRALLLLKIYEGVHSLLREPAAERSWISSTLPAFGNRTILDTMRGGSIADLILVKAFVDHANGR